MDPTQGRGECKTNGEILTHYVSEGGAARNDARCGDLLGQPMRNSLRPEDSRFTLRARMAFLHHVILLGSASKTGALAHMGFFGGGFPLLKALGGGVFWSLGTVRLDG